MEIEEFLRLAKRRRSIRRWKPDAIPHEYVEKIIEAARWAMSGANAQPCEFIVVKDQETRNRLCDLYLEAKQISNRIEMTRMPELRHHAAALLKQGEKAALRDAPIIIAVLADPRTLMASMLSGLTTTTNSGQRTFAANVGNAVHMIHLAAAALGLGAQWISVVPVLEAKIKALLGVPDVYEIHVIVPIGYPAYEPKPAYRREVSEILHFDRYDMSKYRSGEQVVEYILNLRKKTAPGYYV